MQQSPQHETTRPTVMAKFQHWFVAFVAAVSASKWAAAATAATAGVVASAAGIDPWPWVIGGFGAAIVYVKRPSTTKPDAVVNALISVMIGGIISPMAAAGVSEFISPKLANQYALALMLSTAWPWLLPAALDRVKAWKVPGSSDQGG